MHRALMLSAVVTLVIAGAAQGETMTISGPSQVWDSPLRGDWPDANIGQNGTDRQWRMFSDTNDVMRHNLMKFDLSDPGLAGATINSAKVGIYIRRNGGTVGDVTGYKISRLLTGKGWVEGTNDYADPAFAGDSTWNSQAHGSVLWNVPGATGAADIDLGSTVSWDLAGGSADIGYREIDITALVQAWASGAENNGIVWWGGSGGSDSSRYNWAYLSESVEAGRLPYLSIDYTAVPEPATLLLLAGGLALARRRRA